MDSLGTLAVEIAVKVTILLAAGLLVASAVDRRRPSLASLLLRLTTVVVLLLPFLSGVLPDWPIPCLPASPDAPLAGSLAGNVSRPLETSAEQGPAVEAPTPWTVDRPAIEVADSEAVGGSGNSAAGDDQVHAVPVGGSFPSDPAGGIGTRSWWLPWIAGVYVLGVVVALGRLTGGLVTVSKLRSQLEPMRDDRWLATLARWKQRVGVRHAVGLASTRHVPVPTLVGICRPVVLIPESLQSAEEEERDAALLHELVHVRRRDAFWQLLLEVARAVYWWNPLIWSFARASNQARETVCDEMCAFYLGRASYSQSLGRLAAGLVRWSTPVIGLAMARTTRLARRMRRLGRATLRGEYQPRLSTRMLLTVGTALGCWLLSVAVPVQRIRADNEMSPPQPAASDQGDEETSRAGQREEARADRAAGPQTLSGRVLGEDGQALKGARVTVTAERSKLPGHADRGENLDRWECQTDQSGRFEFTVDSSTGASKLELRIWTSAAGHIERKDFVDIELADKSDVGAFRLTRGREATGRVLDPSGKPIAGARITKSAEVKRRYDWEPSGSMTDRDGSESYIWDCRDSVTDAEGKFATTLPADSYVEYRVYAPGWAPQRVPLEAQGEPTKEIRLEAGTALQGQVVDRDGSPVPGCVVSLSAVDDGEIAGLSVPIEFSVKTGADGRFQLPPVRGDYKLSLSQEGRSLDRPRGSYLVPDPASPPFIPVIVSLDGSVPQREMTLQAAPTATVEGTARWEDGSPVEGLEVRAFHFVTQHSSAVNLDRDKTDAQGRYELSVPVPLAELGLSAFGARDSDGRWLPAHPARSVQADRKQTQYVAFKDFRADLKGVDWVLKPWPSRDSGRPAFTPRDPEDQPGAEAMAELVRKIEEAQQRCREAAEAAESEEERQKVYDTLDPRILMQEECFRVEREHRGTVAAVVAIRYLIRSAASLSTQKATQGRRRAIALLQAHYLQHPDLDCMIDDFEGGQWEPSVEPLLRKVAAQSPHPYVRAAALYRLALFLHRTIDAHQFFREWASKHDGEWYERMIAIQKTESAKDYFRRQRELWTAAGEQMKDFDPAQAREEAMQLLERVLDEYAGVETPQYRAEGPAFVRFVRGREPRDWGAVEMAEALHFQLTRLGLGQEAPEIEGEDLDDQRFKLSDYRGQVVVLTVGHALGTDTTILEKCAEFLAEHEGRPLAVLSVVRHQPAHPYYAENTARDSGITWRVFRDPTPQRIQRFWCQETSPEVYVLDREGIIRFHGDRDGDFQPVVKELLAESP